MLIISFPSVILRACLYSFGKTGFRHIAINGFGEDSVAAVADDLEADSGLVTRVVLFYKIYKFDII